MNGAKYNFNGSAPQGSGTNANATAASCDELQQSIHVAVSSGTLHYKVAKAKHFGPPSSFQAARNPCFGRATDQTRPDHAALIRGSPRPS